MDIDKHVQKLMKQVRTSAGLPSSHDIVAETFARLGYTAKDVTPAYVRSRFNHMLHRVWCETLVVLEEHEDACYVNGIPAVLATAHPEEIAEAEGVAKGQGFEAGVKLVFARWYPYLRRCFLSISQSRKTRGGKDFELQLERLLQLAQFRFAKQERENRTDLVLPDVAVYETHPNIVAIASLKRTLRERWAEVAEELFNLRVPNIYLVTADTAITPHHVRRICGDYRIWLVVWDEVKASKYPAVNLVIGFSRWLEDLSHLEQRWPR